MKLLYFAWLRQKIGTAEEDVTPPAEVTDVAGLIDWLRGRGPAYAEALRDERVVKVAVNQEYVRRDHPVRPGDEIALFPPVTGG
ncbi:molybdopterin converting factor subunit 1 [Oceanibaculum pacificum]|uniref:Molybdopterin synthase sulfur carrier subunit n=1 Tax=Oceanibaculum pacificum TaxID=580166 RepID=A0A154W851_9PROT|nr:molybdopterin converting factor subunit 1 [Oceanibaculum pacificum]KZD09682.1 molybdopterin synthase sulfur carrier subunit [Oceanibaculum pacificum]